MVVTVTGQILALAGLVLLAALLQRTTRLELTLACVATGFLAGLAIPYVGFDTGIRAYNLQDIVFFIILPVLVFEAAWHIRPALLRRWLPPVLLLATAGVLVSCFVCAAIVYFGIAHPQGFPWSAALLTGAILAATDPIAVINQLRAQKAAPALTTIFEGESLFNDASAVVLFALFLSLALDGGSTTLAGQLAQFAIVFFGGIVFGILAGALLAGIARFLARPATTPIVLLFAAFGSFYVAEHLLHVSGIMAVMFAALVMRWRLAQGEGTLDARVSHLWEWLAELFTAILFVVMGLTITVGMFTSQWLAMLIAIGAALVARACAVGLCGLAVYPLKSRLPMGWQVLLVWGGLRGAIAVALVLALPVQLEYWYTVQSMVFGVVLFSLLVQGTTNAGLVRRYGAGQ